MKSLVLGAMVLVISCINLWHITMMPLMLVNIVGALTGIMVMLLKVFERFEEDKESLRKTKVNTKGVV